MRAATVAGSVSTPANHATAARSWASTASNGAACRRRTATSALRSGPARASTANPGLLQHRVQHGQVLAAGQLVAHDLGRRRLHAGTGQSGGEHLDRRGRRPGDEARRNAEHLGLGLVVHRAERHAEASGQLGA